MKRYLILLAVVPVLALSGCATTLYEWNGYDSTLHEHYKNPQDSDAYTANLLEIINDGEPEGKVPPGIYAEYGYTFYEKGKFDEAVQYFQKESDKWPESKAFMTKMIANVKNRQKVVAEKGTENAQKQ